MKKIISGKRLYLKMKDIIWIDVPLYDELYPKNIIKEMKLKEKNEKETWELLMNFCPELECKEHPKDRDFFFNVLNTIKPE